MNLKNNPELIPLIEWWEKSGKQTLIVLAAVLVVFGGYMLFQKRAATAKAEASAATQATTVAALEQAYGAYGDLEAGNLIGLKLAKTYFDEGKYEDAMAKYDELAGKDLDGLELVPAVGKAFCLEGMKKYDEAIAAFDKFVAENPSSYLTLTAQIGAARALAEKGDKDGANNRLAALKTSLKSDADATARLEEAETLIKRMK